jgi:hypothetical protein
VFKQQWFWWDSITSSYFKTGACGLNSHILGRVPMTKKLVLVTNNKKETLSTLLFCGDIIKLPEVLAK